MFKLISATPSPYARKVRIALMEKSLPFELLTEVPWHSTTSTPLYNPLEKLPVLLLPDGSSVYESSYILQYLRDVQLCEGQNCLMTGGGACAPAGVSWVFLEPTKPQGDAHAPR